MTFYTLGGGGTGQVYTQGLHRREFEVGYSHRREKALREGEDASIELARQMAAQVEYTRNGTIFQE